MAEKHLKREPHRTETPRIWWYEENGGIRIIVRSYGDSHAPVQEVATISWRSIRAALKRKDK